MMINQKSSKDELHFSSFKWPPPHFDKFILLRKKQSKIEIACQKIDTEHLTEGLGYSGGDLSKGYVQF